MRTEFPENPKMAGSRITDLVPQGGERCPFNCDQCYGNVGFYTDVPLMRPIEEGKIYRVNSWFDSNWHTNYVIEATACYEHRFFNTSIPKIDHFPAPVVLTVNGPNTDYAFWAVIDRGNLMAVRVRVNSWNIEQVVDPCVGWYVAQGVPVLLTFMRYYDKGAVKCPNDYEEDKLVHIVNKYYDITSEAKRSILERYDHMPLVMWCYGHYCRDCNLCEGLYWRAYWRMNWRKIMEEDDAR